MMVEIITLGLQTGYQTNFWKAVIAVVGVALLAFLDAIALE